MKRFTKIISTLLCIVIVVSTPMQALAATNKYISDLRISVADTSEEAKAELTEMGYTVFEGDLNAGAGKSPTLDNKKHVYLGYKTTSNSKEAITDVSVMNMNGSYSMGKYQKALLEKAEHIDALLRDFLKITKEFQANYQSEKKTALLAYQLLNQFKEDDSGMLLGDFLITHAQDEAQLTKVFMQGNHTVLVFMFRALAIGCTEHKEGNNWLQKFSEADPYEYYEPETYDNHARDVLKMWDMQRDMLLDCTKVLDELASDDEKQIKQYVQSLPEEDQYALTESFSYYVILDSYQYDGASMVEFFLKNGDEVDISELYPLVSCLTEGQRELVGYVGIDFLARYAFMSDEDLDNAHTEFQNILEDVECEDTYSIYIGIDRKLFDGGVGFTDNATRESNSTANNDWALYDISTTDVVKLNVITGALSGITLLKTAGNALLSFAKNTTIKVLLNTMKENGVFALLASGVFLEKLCAGSLELFTFYFNNLLIINVGITMIKLSITLAKSLYDYYHPEYTEIPKTMIDVIQVNDTYQYVHYYTVKDVSGNAADVNGWDAKEWNALYVTKDADAGVPLTTDMLRIEGDGSLQTRCMAVHYFGETGAYNLNKYSYNDKSDGVYLHIKKGEESLNASVFSDHLSILLIGAGFMIGIAIGGLGGYVLNKHSLRRKNNEKV